MKDVIENIPSLEADFKIFRDAGHMPVTSHQSSIQFGIVAFCTKGSAEITVYTKKHRLAENELVILLPCQLVSINEISKDFTVNYFIISQALFNDTLSGICRFSPLFFIYMRNKLHYELKGAEIDKFMEFFNVLYKRAESKDFLFRREYIISLLRLLYLDLYNNYKTDLLSGTSKMDARKEELAYDYFMLVMKHYKEYKDVAFYAEKLCITPKYLTSVIKDVSGRPAKDWILEYVVLDIKSYLKNSSLNIQQIASQTKFSNQASLGRFFKQHTGMTPSAYRAGRQEL